MRFATRVSLVIGVAVLAAAFWGVEPCQAQPPMGAHPGGGGWQAGMPGMDYHGLRGYRWGWGSNYHGGWASLYRTGRIPIPPYFALHPPVYYSQPVPRTYGYSPHAYPGWVPTPEIVEPQPQTIVNPFLDAPANESQLEPPANQSSVENPPKVTYNPFVKSPAVQGEEKLARVVSR